MFSTVRDGKSEGNRKVPPRCAETVERSKFLWKKKENRVSNLGTGQNVVAGDIPYGIPIPIHADPALTCRAFLCCRYAARAVPTQTYFRAGFTGC
jgi:hypothetical protein